MYYLCACNSGLFKSYYCYLLFLPFQKFYFFLFWEKPVKYYENYFFFHFDILLKKIPLSINVRHKCVITKVNLFFFGDTKKVQIFPSEIGHFERDHRFLFSKQMGNIRSCNEVRQQKLVKFRLSGLYFEDLYSLWRILTSVDTVSSYSWF